MNELSKKATALIIDTAKFYMGFLPKEEHKNIAQKIVEEFVKYTELPSLVWEKMDKKGIERTGAYYLWDEHKAKKYIFAVANKEKLQNHPGLIGITHFALLVDYGEEENE